MMPGTKGMSAFWNRSIVLGLSPGRETEAHPGIDGPFCVLLGHDRAGTQQHLGQGLGNGGDGIGRGSGTEGNFDDIDTAFQKGFSQRHGVSGVLDDDYRDDLAPCQVFE